MGWKKQSRSKPVTSERADSTLRLTEYQNDREDTDYSDDIEYVEPIERAPEWWSPAVSHHALERLQEHLQDATKADVSWDVAGGTIVPGDVAMSVLVRSMDARRSKDVYVFGRSRYGLYVISEAREHLRADYRSRTWCVVTYIRLNGASLKWLRENY